MSGSRVSTASASLALTAVQLDDLERRDEAGAVAGRLETVARADQSPVSLDRGEGKLAGGLGALTWHIMDYRIQPNRFQPGSGRRVRRGGRPRRAVGLVVVAVIQQLRSRSAVSGFRFRRKGPGPGRPPSVAVRSVTSDRLAVSPLSADPCNHFASSPVTRIGCVSGMGLDDDLVEGGGRHRRT